MQKITVTPIVNSANWIVCAENSNILIDFEPEQNDHSPDFDESIMETFQAVLDADYDLQYSGVSHNWFMAAVTVKYRGYEITEYLGGCSYASFDEFVKEPDGYFSDMVNTCVDQINEQIEILNLKIQSKWNLRKEMIAKGEYLFFLSNRKKLQSF